MTIKDIARLCGCSVGTVSRVLNHHPDVSDATRQRVMAVVEEQKFQPNTNAKHLKQQAGTSIAILVKGTQNMLFAGLVEKIQVLLRQEGRDAAVYYLDEDANEVAYAVRLCRERKPPGILFLGGDLEHFQSGFRTIHVPCVLLTNSGAELPYQNLSSLATDDEAAACQVITHLMDKGHRRIGMVGGNWSCSQISYRRLQGCQRAFEERGLPFDPERQGEPSRYSMGESYQAALRLLDRCPDLTAIFAVSDVTAIGVLRALADRGRRVPEDISLVGFDGVAVSEYCLPRLTTVCQDTGQLARRGVELLLQNIRRPQPPVHEYVPFRLVERESVGEL